MEMITAWMSALVGFDWVVVLVVGAAAGFGLMRGFIAEVASLAAWVAGFIAVRLAYAPARAVFAEASGSEMIGALAAVLGPFLLTVLIVKLAGSFLSSSAKGTVLGPLDRLMGLGFGLVKGFLICALLFLLITLGLRLMPGDGERPEWLARARTTPTLALVASAMVSYVADTWRQVPAETDPHAGLPGFGGDEAGERPGREKPGAGYDRDDRSSLDKLLDEQEKTVPSTAI